MPARGRAGTLVQEYRDEAVLPGWEGKRRVEADEDRWQERLKALVAYKTGGNDDWPRHKAFVTGEEHELGVWLHTQRYKARRGELAVDRAEALDAAVPGWRTGRQRGRRAGSQTS